MNFVDLHHQYKDIKPKILKRIERVLDHGQYLNGPEISELELQLTRRTGSHTICCGSGTDALIASLLSLGVRPGNGIITTPFTFIATAEVIKLLGATPFFVDVDHETFNIDPAAVERCLEKRYEYPQTITGIIAVDIFGCPADYNSLNEIAKKYDLFVISDAAQSFGALSNGRNVGSLADITTTSFFPAKPLGCYGDGGAIFTGDKAIALKLKSIIQHGKGDHKYNNVRLGFNGRMDTIQAAILLEKLELFDIEISKRNEIAQKYNKELDEKYKRQLIQFSYMSSYAQYSLLYNGDRNSLIQKLKKKEIPVNIYYEKPLHLQQSMKSNVRLPVSEYISEHIFSIPVHPYMLDSDVERIITVLNEI
jgi:UDP-2-acetamido-2-deoxy-ribo-hexuluronate aminotransferase